MARKKDKKKDPVGLLIPGGLFIGMGVGFLMNNLVPGLFIGLGVGFVVAAILYMLRKK
jgi:hypothetical protein